MIIAPFTILSIILGSSNSLEPSCYAKLFHFVYSDIY